MEFFKKCPLFLILLGTGLLFTVIGILGKNNLYAGQEYDPATTPYLSLMFRAVNDDIYPWQVFEGDIRQAMAVKEEPEMIVEAAVLGDRQENSGASGVNDGQKGAGNASGSDGQSGAGAPLEKTGDEGTGSASGSDGYRDVEGTGQETEGGQKGTIDPDAGTQPGAKAVPSPGTEPKEEAPVLERLEPLRESTHEEYMNHISADIYGDAGVVRASAYEFCKVDESYFDDALFIGDSRTVGLRDYTDLSEHGDFYCETSLTIHKVMEEDFGGKGTIEEALKNKDYGKIYLMVGINELGRGTTENYMEAYTEVVDTLRELEPEAKIFVQAVMRVSGEKSNSDAIFNNSNINARNNAIATLADNRQIFYIDVNEAVCDEEGNLNEEYTHDKIHLLGMYNDLWKEFLLAHGVADD